MKLSLFFSGAGWLILLHAFNGLLQSEVADVSSSAVLQVGSA